jgi:hypothetical protein
MASISKTFESLKEKTDLNLIRPLQDGLRFLSNLFEGDRQTEEQIHVNDDSQDYSEGILQCCQICRFVIIFGDILSVLVIKILYWATLKK